MAHYLFSRTTYLIECNEGVKLLKLQDLLLELPKLFWVEGASESFIYRGSTGHQIRNNRGGSLLPFPILSAESFLMMHSFPNALYFLLNSKLHIFSES